jgi:hypothetical protein
MVICFDCGSVKVCAIYDSEIFLCKRCYEKRNEKDKLWLEKNKGYY